MTRTHKKLRAQRVQDPQLRARAARLGQLLRHLTRRTSGEARVAFPKAPPIAAVFWPAATDPFASRALWRDLLAITYDPEGKGSLRRAQAAIDEEARCVGLLPLPSPTNPERPTRQALLAQWQQERTRVSVEKLLGPLLVHPESSFARDLMAGFVAQVEQEPSKDGLARITNPLSYTFYRPVDTSTNALLRVLAFPPRLEEILPALQDLPAHLQLLHGALHTLYYHAVDQVPPLDAQEAGLTFAKNGFVFINWLRLARSPFWPQTVSFTTTLRGLRSDAQARQQHEQDSVVRPGHRLHPDTLAFTLVRDATKSPRRFKSALIAPTDAPPSHLPAHMVARHNFTNRYLTLCQETGCFKMDEEGFEPSTLIDPLVLAQKPDFFDGNTYRSHADQQIKARAARLRAAGLESGSPPATKPAAKVYAVPFRPWEFIREHVEKPPWFGTGVTEHCFAVKRKGGYFFTHPSLLNKELLKTEEGKNEANVWFHALDSLKILERVHEPGDPLDFTEQRAQWRSRYFAGVKQDKVLAVAKSIWEHIETVDELKQSQLQLVMARLRSQFSEQTGEHGRRWYYRMVADATREITSPHDVRRVLAVILPGQESEKPEPQHFYTPFAIDVFERFAAVSLGLMDPEVLTTDPTIRGLYSAVQGRPAYYIYAWTQFCKKYRTASPAALCKRKGPPQLWTPQEDLLVLKRYRKPRMLNGAWNDLLSDLYNICGRDVTLNATHLHMTKMNALLEQALHPTTYEKHSFGGCYGPGAAEAEVRSRRTVLLLGYLLYHQRSYGKLYKQLPNVNGILRRPDEDILAVDLPQTYQDRFFRDFC